MYPLCGLRLTRNFSTDGIFSEQSTRIGSLNNEFEERSRKMKADFEKTLNEKNQVYYFCVYIVDILMWTMLSFLANSYAIKWPNYDICFLIRTVFTCQSLSITKLTKSHLFQNLSSTIIFYEISEQIPPLILSLYLSHLSLNV